MLSRSAPFVVATIITVRGSAVAKPGAKAIIDAEGRPVFGWVGGGCVESFVCAEAKEALASGAPRVITADLEDELSGVGLPCGGVMQIFIEPVQPPRRVLVRGESETAHEAARMLERMGFIVTLQASTPETDVALLPEGYAQTLKGLGGGLDLGGDSAAERALSLVAEMLATTRGASARPLQETRTEFEVEAFEAARAEAQNPSLVIVGHSNITEELAWFGTRLGWRVYVDSSSATEESYPEGVSLVHGGADFARMPASSESAVIVATHHKGDHLAIERALEAGAWYVGLIASAHRSKLVRAMLEERPHTYTRLRTPCGLDLGATTPPEIALSIMSEVLACFHGRSCQPRETLRR